MTKSKRTFWALEFYKPHEIPMIAPFKTRREAKAELLDRYNPGNWRVVRVTISPAKKGK